MKGVLFFVFMLLQFRWDVVKFPEKVDIHGLDIFNKDIWAVCGKDGIVGITQDGGLSWNLYHIPPELLFTAVDVVDENTLWVVGERGWIVRFDVRSGKWKTFREPTSYHLLDIFFVTPSDGWAVGDWGEIVHWTGIEWKETPLSISAKERGIMEPIATHDIVDKSGNVLVKKNERIPMEILKMIDEGKLEGEIRYDVVLNTIRSYKGDLWIGAEGGRLFVRSEGKWNEVNVGEKLVSQPSIFAITFYDNYILAGGAVGYMVKVYYDGSMEKILPPVEKDILSLDIKGDTVCIAGNDALAGISVDGGKTFALLENDEYQYHWFRRTRVVSDNSCVFVGMEGTILRVTK